MPEAGVTLPGVKEASSKRMSIFAPTLEEIAQARSIPKKYLDSNGLPPITHDAFATEEQQRSMSGLVIQPAPKLPWAETEDEDDTSGDYDDDDDDDDDSRQIKTDKNHSPRHKLNKRPASSQRGTKTHKKESKKHYVTKKSHIRKNIKDKPGVVIDATDG